MYYEKIFSNLTFSTCLIISIISFSSLIFPILLVEITNSQYNKEINIFEMGGWAIPIIISNIIFLGVYFLYSKKKLPTIIEKLIDYISRNDLSRRNSVIILAILFSIYIIFSIDEFQYEEFELGDYVAVEKAIREYDIDSTKIISNQIRNFLLYSSHVVFDNLRIIPFFASISLLFTTYFLTLEITKKRFAGIISFSVLLQSNLFLLFDTTSTYANFWTLFYLLSIYLIFKKPVGSHVLFIFSLMSKAIIITLLPINLFTIKISKTSKRNKIFLLLGYIVLILFLLIGLVTNNIPHSEKLDFDADRLIPNMNEFGNSLRYDGLILVLFFPILLILRNRSKFNRDKINFIFIAISFAIISQPVMNMMIGMTLQPYRFIPVIVFFAIAVGMIFSNFNKVDQQ